MEVITEYTPIEEIWKLENLNKFLGINSTRFTYEFGITPQDPNNIDCFYINVWIEMKIQNLDENVFVGKTFNCFQVRNFGASPTVEFYFDLVDKATFEFAQIFDSRKTNTHISTYKIPIPMIEDYRAEISQCIQTWERTIKNSSLN